MSDHERLYITTPIYYLNARPHIGHAYCTVLVDAMARWHRMFGGEAFFLTGTDEHGQKVAQVAEARGVSPQAHVDAYASAFRDLWPTLHIETDDFIRTTEERHQRVVRDVLTALWDRGEIYADDYEGWYSTAEERFWAAEELVDGRCPASGQEVQWLSERNYFFRMSKYGDALRQHILDNPGFIRPANRANEVLGFLDKGLKDLCISRPRARLAWGIPLPFAEDYVTYVWVDALTNYISALGGPGAPMYEKWWPHAQHFIGKDILTTHAVYWTTMLMALGLPLPRRIVATGWWLSEDRKMSKSVGNVVDPLAMKDVYGPDVLRYFLLRDMVVGLDSSFSEEALVSRNNSDLANDLGNLARRAAGLIGRWFDGRVPEPGPPTDAERAVIAAAESLVERLPGWVEELAVHTAIEETLQLVRGLNRYITQTEPYKVVKTDPAAAARSLYTVLEGLRFAAWCLHPVMPEKMDELLRSLGQGAPTTLAELKWGGLAAGTKLAMEEALFPRRDMPVREEAPAPAAAEATNNGKDGKDAKPARPAKADKAEAAGGALAFEDFLKVELRVGTVLVAEPVAGADKLLRLEVDLGDEKRQIVAGIAKHFTPDGLIGRQVSVVANLAPRKVFGVMSQGMVLAVDRPDGGLALLSPTSEVAPGTRIQ